MRTTRRKSKATAAAAATAAQDAATRENSPTVFTVEIPEDVDFDTLNSLLPDFNLTNPSPDAIVSLYRLLVGQSDEAETALREHEEARAEIQRKDIELDQAIQDRETATAGLEDTLETVQKELAQVKHEKDELGTQPHLMMCCTPLIPVMQLRNAPNSKPAWTLSQPPSPHQLWRCKL